LNITKGEQGFPAGLYVTSGPVRDDRSDRLIHIDSQRHATIVKGGFTSNETLVFARGEYGNGMLITEPLNLRILRLLPNGGLTVFAELGTQPFGPAALFYDVNGQLYVTDFSSGNVLRVHPDGSNDIFVSILLPALSNRFTLGVKGPYGGGGFGGGGASRDFLFTVFTGGPEPTGLGAVYSVSPDGNTIE
jgi:hypothetical protein